MIDDKYLETTERPFMHIKERSATKMEPRGIPHFICSKSVDTYF